MGERGFRPHLTAAVLVAAAIVWPSAADASDPLAPWRSPEPGDPARGGYVLHAAGCASCHGNGKKGPYLAGGAPLKTPAGVFHPPNITPDPETGIGGWSLDQFITAMVLGEAPDGSHYYPAFPYTSYTRMRGQDLADLKAYLDTVPAVTRDTPAHELAFPYSIRSGLGVWKAMYFEPGPLAPDPNRSDGWNRGAYLVTALGHCAECHSPRNFLGALNRDRLFAGTKDGPDGGKVPNITPDAATGLGDWSKDDIILVLQTGLLPDGDSIQDSMSHVVENTTGKLTYPDVDAIADYLMALPPLPGP